MTILNLRCLAVSLVCLGAIAGVSARGDDSVVSQVPEVWRYRMTIELSVDGSPLSIDRTIQCLPKKESAPSGKTFRVWYRERLAISEVTKDGKAVLVVTPSLCAINQPLVGNYRPLVLVLDDAHSPRRLTAYYDLAAGGENDHVKIKSVSVVAPVDDAVEESNTDLWDWVEGGGRDPVPQGVRERFVGVTAYSIPVENLVGPFDWQYKQLQSALRSRSESGRLTGEMYRLSVQALNGSREQSLVNQGFYPTAKHKSLSAGQVEDLAPARNGFPLRQSGHSLSLDIESAGRLEFVKSNIADLKGSIIDLPATSDWLKIATPAAWRRWQHYWNANSKRVIFIRTDIITLVRRRPGSVQ